MSGVLDFNAESIKQEFKGIKSEFTKMETAMSKALKDFIKEMPEYKAINPTDKTAQDNFWKSLAADGKKPTTAELIDYVARNFSINLEGKAGELEQKIEAARKACLDTCVESAVSLIKRQNEIIKENDRIIEEEKGKLANVRQELATTEARVQDLETRTNNEQDPQKKAKLQTEWDLATNKLTRLQDDEKALTEGDTSIEAHQKKQVEFKKANNAIKRDMKTLFEKNGITLPGQENAQQAAGIGDQAATPGNQMGEGEYAGEGQYIEEDEDFTKYTSMQPVEYEPLDSRKSAKEMLKNLRSSSKKNQMLDGIGYGDILAMSKKLGVLGRIQLKNMILNRSEELGITPDKLSELATEIPQMEADMARYNDMTPQERTAFDQKMMAFKYGTLLRETNRGPIMRWFQTTFGKDAERTDHASALLTRWSDNKAETNKARFGLLNKLRVAAGKSEVPKDNIYENPRGQTGKDARYVPTTGDEGR